MPSRNSETIPEDQVKDDDVVVEHIHEDAKTGKKKKTKTVQKKLIEVSSAKDLVKTKNEFVFK